MDIKQASLELEKALKIIRQVQHEVDDPHIWALDIEDVGNQLSEIMDEMDEEE